MALEWVLEFLHFTTTVALLVYRLGRWFLDL
jgi:hypothetical protein